jgi:hypothetical protein
VTKHNEGEEKDEKQPVLSHLTQKEALTVLSI